MKLLKKLAHMTCMQLFGTYEAFQIREVACFLLRGKVPQDKLLSFGNRHQGFFLFYGHHASRDHLFAAEQCIDQSPSCTGIWRIIYINGAPVEPVEGVLAAQVCQHHYRLKPAKKHLAETGVQMHKGMSNQRRPRLVASCLPRRVDVCQQQCQHGLSCMMCLAALFELE